MKIIFFGTSNVALPVLEAVNRSCDVAAVITSPDAKAGRKQEFAESPVSALARDLKLPLYKPEKIKSNTEFKNQLLTLAPELAVVVSYGKILPKDILELPSKGTLNVHFSALPKYRGASPIQYALLHGDEYTGTSIFLLDEQVDHGPLLAQKIVKIDPDDNMVTLSERLAQVSAAMVNETIADYMEGRLTPLPQDESAATFTKIISKDDGKIDWHKSASEIYNQFRAFFPWPGIWTTWNGKNLKITDCVPLRDYRPSATPPIGQVLPGGAVACGSHTYLQINSLQLEGKKTTDIRSFLNGYGTLVGSVLE